MQDPERYHRFYHWIQLIFAVQTDAYQNLALHKKNIYTNSINIINKNELKYGTDSSFSQLIKHTYLICISLIGKIILKTFTLGKKDNTADLHITSFKINFITCLYKH